MFCSVYTYSSSRWFINDDKQIVVVVAAAAAAAVVVVVVDHRSRIRILRIFFIHEINEF